MDKECQMTKIKRNKFNENVAKAREDKYAEHRWPPLLLHSAEKVSCSCSYVTPLVNFVTSMLFINFSCERAWRDSAASSTMVAPVTSSGDNKSRRRRAA